LHSPAAALGGGLLALAGLRRGGLSGLAMTTAGGALIGFKYGGPLGAAIGAGAGAVAGIVRLFVNSAEQKAREKIKVAQSGGALFQQGPFSNGSPAFAGLSTIGLDRIGAGAMQNAGPIVIKLDGPATTALLRGEAVQAIAENPRAVQAASLSATKANAGRRELLSLQLSPGTLTSYNLGN